MCLLPPPFFTQTQEQTVISQSLTMPNTKTVHVPHLGDIDAAYQMPHPYDPTKPTLVLVNSFTTSSELYGKQYENKELTDKMNLVAIELLGHGQTRTRREHWTYWDTAEMNLQVLDALNIEKAFVLGTSQGGWITVRMALMRPEKVCTFYMCMHMHVQGCVCDRTRAKRPCRLLA